MSVTYLPPHPIPPASTPSTPHPPPFLPPPLRTTAQTLFAASCEFTPYANCREEGRDRERERTRKKENQHVGFCQLISFASYWFSSKGRKDETKRETTPPPSLSYPPCSARLCHLVEREPSCWLILIGRLRSTVSCPSLSGHGGVRRLPAAKPDWRAREAVLDCNGFPLLPPTYHPTTTATTTPQASPPFLPQEKVITTCQRGGRGEPRST